MLELVGSYLHDFIWPQCPLLWLDISLRKKSHGGIALWVKCLAPQTRVKGEGGKREGGGGGGGGGGGSLPGTTLYCLRHGGKTPLPGFVLI